jgi:hypothetical protein
MTADGRLDPEMAASVLASAQPIAVRTASTISKVPLIGRSPRGERVARDMQRTWQLLLFVSSTCHGCQDLLSHLEDGGRFGLHDSDVVLVLRDGDVIEPPGVTVLIADELWQAYGVSGPPFFSLIHAHTDHVVTEGVAWGVASISEAVARARAGQPHNEVHRFP